MSSYKLLGINDEVSTCDCCGKKNLKVAVALEDEGGGIVHYGRDCAGRALYGSKSSRNTSLAELRGRARMRVDPVIVAIRNALPLGLEAAKAAGMAVTEKGWIYWNDRVRGEYCDTYGGRVGGMQISISGFVSWGCIRVNYCGGNEAIPLPADLIDGKATSS